MAYCQKCGAKLEDGDLFCPNCGARQDQQQQSSQQVQSYQPVQNYGQPGGQQVQNYQQTPNYGQVPNYQQAPNYGQNNTNFNVNLNSVKPDLILKTLVDMLLKPVSAAKKFVKEGEKGNTIALTVLLIIVQGILGIWKASQIVGNVQSLADSLVKGMASIVGSIVPGADSGMSLSASAFSEISKLKAYIKIPYANIFLQNCGVFIIGVAVLFAVIYLGITVLCKNKADLFSVYKAVIIAAVPILYFQLFSIIVSYASLTVGICLVLIGWFISAACLTVVVKDALLVDENYSVFFTAVSFVVSFIIVLLLMKKFISSDVVSVVKNLQSAISGML